MGSASLNSGRGLATGVLCPRAPQVGYEIAVSNQILSQERGVSGEEIYCD